MEYGLGPYTVTVVHTKQQTFQFKQNGPTDENIVFARA
jgi:hypothetical protein